MSYCALESTSSISLLDLMLAEALFVLGDSVDQDQFTVLGVMKMESVRMHDKLEGCPIGLVHDKSIFS